MKAVAALNVYKKVAIIRRSTDSLTYEDADGTIKTVADLGQAASTATPALATNKSTHEIPVPQIKTVEDYDRDVPNNYAIKNSFVRYHRPSRAEWLESIDYVADAEDETWLSNNSKFGGAIIHPHQQQQQQRQLLQLELTNSFDNNDTVTAASTTTTTAVSAANAPALATMNGQQVLLAGEALPSGTLLPKRPHLPLPMFEHMMDVLEKATGFDAIVSSGQAEHLIHEKVPGIVQVFPVKAKAGVVTTKHVINDIYNYWVQKRSKLKRPLLRRFWPVTSTDDTNPHLVFRPREKEKYKLRKTRRNDMLSFNKMKQLRSDFDSLRLILDLVRRREELHRAQIQIQCEMFEQKLFDITDTSGKPRISDRLNKRDIDNVYYVPTYFDVNIGGTGKKGKRGRRASSRSVSPVPSSGGRADVETSAGSTTAVAAAAPGSTAADNVAAPRIVAGQNFGEPAPGFLHPLSTRESFVTSWDNAVPHITSYIEAHPVPTFRFRHRPRVGRGGRLCIDRLPCPSHPDTTPVTVFTAGMGLPRQATAQSQKQNTRLLDLLPEPLDHKALSRRIEEISLSALQEDVDVATAAQQGTSAPGAPPSLPPTPVVEGDENDGDLVLVKLEDWLETDEQPWGEERFAIGPI